MSLLKKMLELMRLALDSPTEYLLRIRLIHHVLGSESHVSLKRLKRQLNKACVTRTRRIGMLLRASGIGWARSSTLTHTRHSPDLVTN